MSVARYRNGETADPRPRATVCSRGRRARGPVASRARVAAATRAHTRPSLDWPTKVDVSGLHPDERTRRFCATLACAADNWRPLRLIRSHSHGLTRFLGRWQDTKKPVLSVISETSPRRRSSYISKLCDSLKSKKENFKAERYHEATATSAGAPAVTVAGAARAVPRVADAPPPPWRALAKSCPGLAARPAESRHGAGPR